MRTTTLRRIASGCALAATAGWAWALPPVYNVSCLDCSLGFPLLPMDINAGGVIVAIDDVDCYFPDMCYGGQGYVIDHGIVTPTPSFDYGNLGSSAGAISDLNVVVGTADHTDYPWGPFGYLWDGTTMVDLGDGINDYGDGYLSRATTVNNRGHVAGHASGGYHTMDAFIYRNGRMKKLPSLEGARTQSPFWYVHMNNKDTIVGTAADYRDDGPHAWIYKNGVTTALPIDTYSSWAYGVNDKDEAVGAKRVYREDRQDWVTWPVIWSGGTATVLPHVPAFHRWGFAYDINNHGWVIGDTCGYTVCTAFVYNSNRTFDLNARMDSSGAGWVLSHASAINDAGVIVGLGTFNGDLHGFMATPVVAMGAQ